MRIWLIKRFCLIVLSLVRCIFTVHYTLYSECAVAHLKRGREIQQFTVGRVIYSNIQWSSMAVCFHRFALNRACRAEMILSYEYWLTVQSRWLNVKSKDPFQYIVSWSGQIVVFWSILFIVTFKTKTSWWKMRKNYFVLRRDRFICSRLSLVWTVLVLMPTLLFLL